MKYAKQTLFLVSFESVHFLLLSQFLSSFCFPSTLPFTSVFSFLNLDLVAGLSTMEAQYRHLSLEDKDDGGLIIPNDISDSPQIDTQLCFVGHMPTDKNINYTAMKQQWLVSGVLLGEFISRNSSKISFYFSFST